MLVLAEFLIAVGFVAVVGSLIYAGYKAGKASKENKSE